MIVKLSNAEFTDPLRQAAVIGATLLTLAANAAAALLPLNGRTPAEISDTFLDHFTPAGYVFSIWTLIYIGMIALTRFHSQVYNRWHLRMRKIGWLYVLSGGLNIAWLFAWHYGRYGLSLAIMAGLWTVLALIYLVLDVGPAQPERIEFWSVDAPVSLYLAWISVALPANLTDVLSAGGRAQGPGWGLLMLAGLALLAVYVALSRTDWIFLLVLAWSAAGVGVSEAGTLPVAAAAWALAAAAVGLAGFSLAWRRKYNRRP